MSQTNHSHIKLIHQYALEALLYEATLGPKPGLVDRYNNGAHDDMNVFTFIDSTLALSPYFDSYLTTGLTHQGTPPELFQKVRHIGIQAEEAMLKATNGINTHKGANFSFAIMLAAIGQLLHTSTSFNKDSFASLSDYIQKMCQGLVTKDLSRLDLKKHLSYGEHIYLTYGITGIRSEAEQGYPTLFQQTLPFIRQNQDKDSESLMLLSLLLLMSVTEDTNVIKRSDMNEWRILKTNAQLLFDKLVTSPLPLIKKELCAFNDELVQKNISPGGSADMLALTIFLAKLENIL